jgi:hypothetical protein
MKSLEEQLADITAEIARLKAAEAALVKKIAANGPVVWGEENVAMVTPDGEVVTFSIRSDLKRGEQ